MNRTMSKSTKILWIIDLMAVEKLANLKIRKWEKRTKLYF